MKFKCKYAAKQHSFFILSFKKKKYEEIRWPFIIKISHVEEAEACKNKNDSSFLIVNQPFQIQIYEFFFKLKTKSH
jgi:hypothetical protein